MAATLRISDELLSIGPDCSIRPNDVVAVARDGQEVVLSEAARRAMRASRAVLDRAVARGELVYGVTTGYGPLATEWIGPDLARELQSNLVRHLASGVGEPLDVEQSRALLFCRANVLAQGKSAARVETVETLLRVLNAGLAPVVPSLGTVGASGDLTPLAHAALAVCGEGRMWQDGQIVEARVALADAGIEPVELGRKEGLALVNGTSAMTALSALNDVSARRAIDIAISVGALAAEVLSAHEEAFDPLLADARGQPGQIEAVRRLRANLAGSQRLGSRAGRAPEGGGTRSGRAPQDAYTIRCQQQLIGAVIDATRFHGEVAYREIGAVTDNPLFDPETDRIVHGGNFFGQHVAFSSDTLMTAVIQLAVWAERLVARLTDRSLNEGLPAFLTPRTPGVHSGFMGAQVTASALIAELRSKAVPASIQSVPTNANNQDVVTMGTIGALRVSQMMPRVFEVLAIASMASAQAFELRDASSEFSPTARAFVRAVREHVEALDKDRPLSDDITRLARVFAHSFETSQGEE